jgi:hypothetical protein
MFNEHLTPAEQRRIIKWEEGTAALEAKLAKRRTIRHAFVDNGLGFCEHCGAAEGGRCDGHRIHR